MTTIPRFGAHHHHGGHHTTSGGLPRIHHPIVMYSNSNSSTSRTELHQHHHHHPSSSGYHQHHQHPPPAHHHHAHHHVHQAHQPHHSHHSLHFHTHYPHATHANTHTTPSPAPHISPPASLHTHHPPPLLPPSAPSSAPPPILQKPPLKEKTPMCLINELVRFNKIKYQYRLTDESGPSHKKIFTVLLKLGNEDSGEVYEEYIASGPSIKKAQHAAAALALEETKLKHPVPKAKPMTNGALMPTVELNTLAMKRREQIQYELIHPYHDPKCQRKDMRRNGKKVTKNGGATSPCVKDISNDKKYIVNLKVGEKMFKGEGMTLKAAKHDAAYAALLMLKNAPASFNKFELDPSSAPFVPGNPLSTKSNNEHKSPVSLVHENALKRNLSVTFHVERESGPPHMRTFITRCTMGEFTTEGHGEAKRSSKKRSAELMLEKLKTLPPLANCSVTKRFSNSNKAHKRKSVSSAKKRAKSLVKLQKSESESDSSTTIHPISKLIQIQQAKKEKEPLYTLIEEKGRKRKLEFIMQVKVGELTAAGSGSNKKLAKRAAAEKMLELMGVVVSTAASTNEKASKESSKLISLKEETKDSDEKCSTNSKMTKNGNGPKNSVPGILYLDNTSKINGEDEDLTNHKPKELNQQVIHVNNSVKNDGDVKTNNSSSNHRIIHQNNDLDFLEEGGEAKVKLAKLSEIFKFSVSYTDFQKRGKSSSSSSEYLTLVSLSMKPTQVSHGSGATPQESQEDAAKSALKFLSENGLEVSSNQCSNSDYN